MTAPRTAAGRALLEALPRFFKGHAYWRDFEPSAPDRILAIEAEAAAEPTALLRADMKRQQEAVALFRREGFVFRGEGGRWEKLAMSLYTDLVEASEAARAYLEEK